MLLVLSEAQTSSLDVTLLGPRHVLGRPARLPGGRANVLNAVGVLEDLLNLLKRLAGRLGEHEEDVDKHAHVEDGKDEVGAPLDVGKRLGDEEPQGRVKSPVGGRAECDTLATELEGEEFGRIRPGHYKTLRSVFGSLSTPFGPAFLSAYQVPRMVRRMLQIGMCTR